MPDISAAVEAPETAGSGSVLVGYGTFEGAVSRRARRAAENATVEIPLAGAFASASAPELTVAGKLGSRDTRGRRSRRPE